MNLCIGFYIRRSVSCYCLIRLEFESDRCSFGLDGGFTILLFCLLFPRFLVGEVRVGRVSCDFLLSFNHSLTNFSIFLLLIITNLVIFSLQYKSYGVSLIKYAFGFGLIAKPFIKFKYKKHLENEQKTSPNQVFKVST